MGILRSLFHSKITRDFSATRAIVILYAIGFFLHYFLSGISITTSWLAYTVPPVGPTDIEGLLGLMVAYPAGKLVDKSAVKDAAQVALEQAVKPPG